MLKLTKRQINQNVVPYLSKGSRGPSCKVGEWRIVRAILYRMRFLIKVQIANACKMLIEGDCNTTQCYFSNGYNNVSNFHRHFSKVTGMIPGEYKQKTLN